MTMSNAPQTRISRRFAALRDSGELGIVAYITAGDPSMDATLEFVLALDEAGADVIELGVPFSDPLADGPTIQRASERALKAGATLPGILELVRRIRKSSQVPLVLFSYLQSDSCRWDWKNLRRRHQTQELTACWSPIFRPRNPWSTAESWKPSSLDTIFLCAPTSTDERLESIAACSTGFLYLVSRTGVTGAKDTLPDDLPALLRRVRSFTQAAYRGGFRDFAAGACFDAGRTC